MAGRRRTRDVGRVEAARPLNNFRKIGNLWRSRFHEYRFEHWK
jgi:hypothetical protein